MRGGANKSFGIEVAKLAGIPNEITMRAKQILKKLEKNDIARGAVEETGEDVGTGEVRELSEAERILLRTDMNNITPMQAFNLLSELSEKVRESNGKE